MASDDKNIVLITGANQGIGWEAAKALVSGSAAYHVIIGSRSIERGQKAISELTGPQIKGSVSLVQLDVTNAESIARAVQQVEKEYGRLDTLVNNAGIISQNLPLAEDLRKTFETNSIAPALVTECFLPLLKKSHNPRLIYVSSGLGSISKRADPNDQYAAIPAITYRMSKAALNMLAASHHIGLKEHGIQTFCYDPGYTVTNLTGEEQRDVRVKSGAWGADVPAKGIATIVSGARDAEAGKFLDTTGILPW